MIKPDETAQARALEAARRQILEHVARSGPVPVTSLPVRWPLTRHQARLVVRDLSRDGMVSFARRIQDRTPVLAITDTGRRALGTAEDS